ncbi:uncharacterized protein Z518_06146 [Rhinocladiella mackenziei CBS 650.93]|uniref:Protein kinase domain-containing protein n=1 Tax=Rhinocladiella mackenziei CBS 650.93 TaxID=1442369 RepID=A0A0D2IHL2_9EURO|nr:uncharacterized protein Z518_06146 [Rhinocladiella mackenziei CBS 650.93]KIX05274.1 hypothetical protein Z518_06146 [Rhinocladiella mackenziei CBS 650.93]
MANEEEDHSGTLPSTPDTVILENHFSPRTNARLQGDFARLIPVNRPAILAFHSIAERMRLDPAWNPHARKYIFVEDSKRQLSPEWDGSDTSNGTKNEPSQVLIGYYRLSLDLIANHPELGWVVGSGRKDLPNGGVDFLLTLQKNKHRVHGRHARLVHHAKNGALMLVVSKGKVVTVNGLERLEGSQRVLGSIRTALSFGNLSYNLEFTGLNETSYREKLGDLLTKRHPNNDIPPMSLELTPQEHHFELHGFTIHSPFASGTSGIVSAGFEQSTGRAVAIKRVRRTPATVARIQLEIRIYKKIGDHPNLCHLMADLYSGGDEYGTGKSKINDVYLVHSPLARQTFVDLTLSNQLYDVRLSAFQQVLEGLAHLHHHGIMHRDIKPTNMMMVSYHPVHAIIIDYGSATFDTTSLDHYCGTISYLAPEILKLKYPKDDSEQEPYDCRVDIWAMGLSGYQLFFQEPCKWEKGVNDTTHKEIVRNLRSRPASVADVLRKMVAWESAGRPAAKELLQSNVWHQVNGTHSDPDLSDSESGRVAKRFKK